MKHKENLKNDDTISDIDRLFQNAEADAEEKTLNKKQEKLLKTYKKSNL